MEDCGVHGEGETHKGTIPLPKELRANRRLILMRIAQLCLDTLSQPSLLAFTMVSEFSGSSVPLSKSGTEVAPPIPCSVMLLWRSQCPLRKILSRTLDKPRPEYIQNIARYESISVHPGRACRVWTSQPHVIVPKAIPTVPNKTYQANISERALSFVRCASVDSSIALKGPISFPLFQSMRIY
jgi:hypothetical protein